MGVADVIKGERIYIDTDILSKTLKLPDAIHFATARMSGCQTFLTNDKQLQSVPDFDVAILSEEMF